MKNDVSTILQCALYMLHKFFLFHALGMVNEKISTHFIVAWKLHNYTAHSYHMKGNFVVKHLTHLGQGFSQQSSDHIRKGNTS